MFYSWLIEGKGAGALAEPCRFPPPWTIEDLDACLVVTDTNRQKLAYVFYEEELGAAIGGHDAQQRRGAADCCELCEAAGAFAGLVNFVWFRPVEGCGQICLLLSYKSLRHQQKTNPATFTINF